MSRGQFAQGNAAARGRKPLRRTSARPPGRKQGGDFGVVAQLAEQLIRNEQVVGPIPTDTSKPPVGVLVRVS